MSMRLARQPAQKAALGAAVAEALESGKTMIKLDRETWAVNSWKAAVRADLRCGSYARAAQVAPLIDSVIKKKGKQPLGCGHLELRAWARLPQVERAFASFSESVATDYSNRVDVCESERLAFAAELIEWAPPGEAQAAAVVAFVDQAVADLKPLQPEPPADKGKAPKAPLPSLGSNLYDVSSAASSLGKLVGIAPDAAATGASRALELWREQWKPGASGGDNALSGLASLGATLAKAGRKPEWLYGLTSAAPPEAVPPDKQASLVSQRRSVALELLEACPAEAGAALKELTPSADALTIAHRVNRVAATDRARADAMARAAWPEVPEDTRYGFASWTVGRLLGVPDP